MAEETHFSTTEAEKAISIQETSLFGLRKS